MNNIIKSTGLFVGPSIGLLLMSSIGSHALAGTQALMEEIVAGKATDNTSTISIEGTLLRFDHSGSGSSQVIFDTAKKEMLVIDHKEKSFMRMNQANIKKIQSKMESAKKQMEEQLAKMPEQQREMMKQMMGDKMKMFAQPEEKVKKFIKTNQRKTVAGHDCIVTDYFVNDNKVNEFCLTPVAEIEGASEIFNALKAMAEMFDELYRSMSNNLPMMASANPFSQINQLDGYPISITHFKSNNRVEHNQLKSIESMTFNKLFFKPPKGYKEKTMGF